jgi:hypothetical protein
MAGGHVDRFGVALSPSLLAVPTIRQHLFPMSSALAQLTFQTRLPEIDFGNLSEFGAAVLYVLCQSTGDLALASDVDDVRP